MTDKIKVIERYKYFIRKNKIKLPEGSQARRRLFISYFVNLDQGVNITQGIEDLSKNYLYISSRTIENILFYNE